MLSESLKTRIEHQVDTRSVRLGAWLYRLTRGRLSRLWHRRSLVLTATGRRSGLPRTVIVQFFPDGQDMVVVAANSGLPSHPGWYFNLMAHPEARVEVEGRTLQVLAKELSPAEAAAFWPRVLDAAPDYARYLRRTTRRIPLVRLVPLEPPAPEALQIHLEELGEHSWVKALFNTLTGTFGSAQYRFVARPPGKDHQASDHREVGATFPVMRWQDLNDLHGPQSAWVEDARKRLQELDAELVAEGWQRQPVTGRHWWSLSYLRPQGPKASG